MSEGLQRRLDGVFLVGLAGVFLANAAVAMLDPEAFTALVADTRWAGCSAPTRAAGSLR